MCYVRKIGIVTNPFLTGSKNQEFAYHPCSIIRGLLYQVWFVKIGGSNQIQENMNAEEKLLEVRIDEAFSNGNNQLGLKLLRNLSSSRIDDAEVYHRLAVIEEQIGSPQNSRAAYLRCLKLAPNNPLAYLYAGYCLQHQGQINEAVSLYSLGAEIDEGILSLWQDPEQSEWTRLRSGVANKTMRKFLSELHLESVGSKASDVRIAKAIWTRTHDQPFQFAQAQQKPQLYYIPELPAKSYALRARGSLNWPWVKPFEKAAKEIKQELLTALPDVRAKGRPYLPGGLNLDERFDPLVGSLNWTALDLYKDGELNQSLASYFPRTLSALMPAGSTSGDPNVPLYNLHDTPFEVFFSLLKPGHHIVSHYGLSNHSLTVHLPLVVPRDCWLRVGTEKHIWKEGELVAFDDTFEHEAMNGSTEERIVLIFSIWHPDLSRQEQKSIQRSFQARQGWLDSRVIPA